MPRRFPESAATHAAVADRDVHPFRLSPEIWLGVILAALSLALAPAAQADWYLGGSVGQSAIDAQAGEINEAFLIDDDFIATDTSLDETDTGWKAFIGYSILPILSIEAGYADLGSATFRTTIVSAPPPNDAIVPFGILGTATAEGMQLSALLDLPIAGPFSVLARAGAFRWETEFTEEIIETGAIRIARSEEQVDPYYGVGVKFAFSDAFAVRVEWERFESVGEGIGGRSGRDVDYYSAGVVLTF